MNNLIHLKSRNANPTRAAVLQNLVLLGAK